MSTSNFSAKNEFFLKVLRERDPDDAKEIEQIAKLSGHSSDVVTLTLDAYLYAKWQFREISAFNIDDVIEGLLELGKTIEQLKQGLNDYENETV